MCDAWSGWECCAFCGKIGYSGVWEDEDIFMCYDCSDLPWRRCVACGLEDPLKHSMHDACFRQRKARRKERRKARKEHWKQIRGTQSLQFLASRAYALSRYWCDPFPWCPSMEMVKLIRFQIAAAPYYSYFDAVERNRVALALKIQRMGLLSPVDEQHVWDLNLCVSQDGKKHIRRR